LRLTLATAFAVLATVAVAQLAPSAPKPYMAVVITPAKAFADPGFAAFRKTIGAAAKSRLYGELEALVLAQGFFWDRDFGRGYDPRRSSADNLAAAIGLERRDGAGWNMLAVLATEDAVEPLDSRPGVVCAPARPNYDSIEFSKLLDKTYTGEIDWAYPRASETVVRSAPQAGAPTVGLLGSQFVRLLGFDGPESDVPGRNQWGRVALPDGKTGYTAPGSLMSLTPDRLCYIKDLVVGWRIAGFVTGGN
jgi:hypothetical protein